MKLNNENKTKVIGILAILIMIWLVLYFIPGIFVSLFNTILGNLILIISSLLIYMNNRMYGLIFGVICLILFRFSLLSKEGFDININGVFTIDEKDEKDEKNRKELEHNFILIQNTMNRQKVFDMDVIKTQASNAELEYFNKNGKWPWSKKVIDLYEKATSRNPYVRSVPEQATNYARTIYNEAAILRLLSYQTKEGDFLLNGILVKDASGNKMEELPSGFGDYPYSSGLLENRVDDVIRCNLDDTDNPKLERIRYEGKGAIFGEQKQSVTPVSPFDLEKIIPGFTFLNKPCNPCGALASNPDYSCGYRLKVKNRQPFISDVWQYLWGINEKPLYDTPMS